MFESGEGWVIIEFDARPELLLPCSGSDGLCCPTIQPSGYLTLLPPDVRITASETTDQGLSKTYV